MAEYLLRYQKDGNVLTVLFPDGLVETEQIETIHYEFADLRDIIAADDEIRVCVIGGISTTTFQQIIDSPSAMELWAECLENVDSFATVIRSIDIPVIISMDGKISGPGLELALACDIRIASKDSSFSFPIMAMGGLPFDGATQMLPRLIGKSKALEMLLTGLAMEAESAYEAGLIHYVVPSDHLQTTMNEMACKMAVNSPVSLKYTKETVTKGLDMTLEQGLRMEADLYFLMHSTDDRKEGINAFMAKRKPVFTGQ